MRTVIRIITKSNHLVLTSHSSHPSKNFVKICWQF